MPGTLLNLLRGVLLTITLAAVATALIWRHRPEWVERVDGAVLDRRFGEARRLHDELQAALRAGGPAAAEDVARRLADETRGMRRRDRYDELRLAALTTLIDAAEARGAGPQELLDLRDDLHDFHPRLLLNEYGRARLLRAVGRAEEAREVMDLALAVGGHLPGLQRRRLADLARDGDAGGLVHAVEAMGFHSGPFAPPSDARFELRAAGPTGGWGEAAAATLQRDPADGQFVLETDLPQPARSVARLRLDLPPRAPMVVRITSVALDRRTLDPEGLSSAAAHQLEVTGPLTFAANGGGDPYVSLVLAQPLDATQVRIVLEARVPAPAEVAAFVGSPEGREQTVAALAGRPVWIGDVLGVTP